MALVLALGVLVALSLSGMAVMITSTSSGRHSSMDRSKQVAYALAESGINNALAVLHTPNTNPAQQSNLPSCANAESTWIESEYEGGTVRWCGTFTDTSTELYWKLTGKGIVRSGVSGSAEVTKAITAEVPMGSDSSKDNTFAAWNYLFSTKTGTTCDMTFSNNVTIGSQVYTLGNLCLDQNVVITSPKVIVMRKLSLENNARIGQSGTDNWSTRSEVQVGGYGGEYCDGTNHWHTMSNGDGHLFCGDADRVYSKNAAQTAMTVSSTPESLSAPVPQWQSWYSEAVPGPGQNCTTTSGTPPTFESAGNTVLNVSVTTIFELAPSSSSYTCRVGPSSDPIGEISWNHSTKVLTVHGTIFIDGSLKMTNTSVNTYVGQATIYVAGTFLMDNGAKLCGGVNADASDCDYANWNPNTTMLAVIAKGDGSLAAPQSQTGSTGEGGNGIKLVNNTRFQGALQAEKNVQLNNNSKVDGPIIASTIVVDNNVTPDAFPTISTVPSGMPGDDPEYAVLNPPRSFSD